MYVSNKMCYYVHNRQMRQQDMFNQIAGGVIMPLSDNALKNKKQYTMEYAKQKLKRIPLDVQIDKYEEIKQASAAAGESVNGYIKKAIDKRLKSGK